MAIYKGSLGISMKTQRRQKQLKPPKVSAKKIFSLDFHQPLPTQYLKMCTENINGSKATV